MPINDLNAQIKTSARHKTASTPPHGRNSSIEFLRIIAMLMIVFRHHILLSNFSIADQPFSIPQLIYIAIVPLGKVGVVAFFLISAWFLCNEKNPTLKKSFHRVWILEREILFYSFTLLVGSFILHWKFTNFPKLTMGNIVKSFIPTLGNMWWYTTAYIVFLALCPFLIQSLRKLHQTAHRNLSVILIIMWGVFYGLFPGNLLAINTENYVEFVVFFIVLTYYRWYMAPWRSSYGWLCIAVGEGIIVIAALVGDLGASLTGISALRKLQTIYVPGAKLPVILIAFGMFIIASNHHSSNRFINFVAKSTLSVYLISLYPPIGKFIELHTNIGLFYNSSYKLLISLGIVLGIFTACILIDLIRRFLFWAILDRNGRAGKWGDFLWTRYVNRLFKHQQKSTQTSD